MNTLRCFSSNRYPLYQIYARFSCLISSKTISNHDKIIEVEDEIDKLYKIVELEVKGNDPAVLKSFCEFAVTAGSNLGIDCKTWSLFKPKHDRLTLLKSVHIYKKHRVQYEYRTYFKFVHFKHLTGSTADTLLEYIQRNLPEGVALKTTKVELQNLPDHFVLPAK